MYLGVDGGGTKTAYALIDSAGRVLASHVGPSVSHLAEGFERGGQLLTEGISTVLSQAQLAPSAITFAFVGLPSYGEDSSTTARMDAMPSTLLDAHQYRCGNDMLCSWSGSLACADGISVIAGTGSVAYGEYEGRAARAGGWSEIIGDEGSAYWIAREGMNLFSRMSDGRAPRGPLYQLVRGHLGIEHDLDLCARVYGEQAMSRNVFAQLALLVHDAAEAGDAQAATIFERAAAELVQLVLAVRGSLAVADDVPLPVSRSGGVFDGAKRLSAAFQATLAATPLPFEYREPQYPPVIGAAIYAARLAHSPLASTALHALRHTGS